LYLKNTLNAYGHTQALTNTQTCQNKMLSFLSQDAFIACFLLFCTWRCILPLATNQFMHCM